MANRCTTTAHIQSLSGALSAATYFDANWDNPVTALNEASLGYVNGIATDTGSAGNYIVSCPFGVPTAYNPGMWVSFIPANSNSGGASTITVNSLTAASIVDAQGNALQPYVLLAGQRYDLIYLAGAFRLPWVNPPFKLIYQANPSSPSTLSINCAGVTDVSISIDTTGGTNGTYTIALQNVIPGTHFGFDCATGGSGRVFKWTGTSNSGLSFNSISSFYPNGGSPASTVNLISSGDIAPAHLIYQGQAVYSVTLAQTNLRFIATFN